MTDAFRRRSVLAGLLAAVTVPAPAQPGLRQVRLLVIRRLASIPGNNCTAPCIRGRLFNVSDINGPLSPASIVATGRSPICDIIERPWRNNAPSQSAIPKGIYPAMIRTDETKDWMKGKPNRAWRLELANVPGGRSNIQFHYGLDEGWSEGCFIVGRSHAQIAQGIGTSYCQVTDGEASVAAIRAAVTGSGLDSSRIEVAVADHGDIFTNPDTTC